MVGSSSPELTPVARPSLLLLCRASPLQVQEVLSQIVTGWEGHPFPPVNTSILVEQVVDSEVKRELFSHRSSVVGIFTLSQFLNFPGFRVSLCKTRTASSPGSVLSLNNMACGPEDVVSLGFLTPWQLQNRQTHTEQVGGGRNHLDGLKGVPTADMTS